MTESITLTCAFYSASTKNQNIEIRSESFTIARIVMSKVMQNLVVLMEPSERAYRTHSKAGNMILNRFCIDKDAAFELSGVNYFKKSSEKMEHGESIKFKVQRKVKGQEYSFLRSHFFEKLNFHEQLIILPKRTF